MNSSFSNGLPPTLRSIFGLLPIAGCVLLPSVASASFERVTERSFAISSGQFLELHTTNADVDIRPAVAGQNLLIRVVTQVDVDNEARANAIIDTIEMSFEQLAHGVSVDIKSGKPGLRWFGLIRVYPEIRVEVFAPAGVRHQITTGSGDVDIRDLEGQIVFASGSGDMDGRNLVGSVSVKTGSGDLDLQNCNGPLHFESGSGDLDAVGSFASLKVTIASGDVSIRSRSVLSEPSSVRTASGDIDLRLPVSAAFKLDAATSSGRVTVDFPALSSGVSSSKGSFAGSTVEDGPSLSLRAASGDINLTAGQ